MAQTLDLSNISIVDFLNEVRSMLPGTYQQQLPIAEAGQKSFSGIGEVLDKDSSFANVWHEQAINLIGKIIQRENLIYNPLDEFCHDGILEEGAAIEEMIIDAGQSHLFNPENAERTLFVREKPKLYSRIHKHARDINMTATLQGSYFQQIFHNEREINNYLVNVVKSLYNGNANEIYQTAKRALTYAVAKNGMKSIDLGTVTAKEFQKEILRHSKLMLHPNRFYNLGVDGEQGLLLQTKNENLRNLISVEASTILDVDFFSASYQLSKVEADIMNKEIDYFPDIWEYTAEHIVTQEDLDNDYLDANFYNVGDTVPAGTEARENAPGAELIFDASRVQAIIMDVDGLMVYDVLPLSLSHVDNPKGRYRQVFLNHKQYFAVSPFVSAICILADIDDNPTPTPTPDASSKRGGWYHVYDLPLEPGKQQVWKISEHIYLKDLTPNDSVLYDTDKHLIAPIVDRRILGDTVDEITTWTV